MVKEINRMVNLLLFFTTLILISSIGILTFFIQKLNQMIWWTLFIVGIVFMTLFLAGAFKEKK